MIGIVSHAKRAALPMRVDKPGWHKIVSGVEITPVRYSERPVCHGILDGPPDVDDAYAPFQELLRLVAKVIPDPLHSRIECLIDVDAFLKRQCMS